MVIGKLEIDTTEYLLNIRGANERQLRENNHLSASIKAQEEMQGSIQRALIAQRAICSNLQDDTMQIESSILKMKQRNSTMQIELDAINNRQKSLQVLLDYIWRQLHCVNIFYCLSGRRSHHRHDTALAIPSC